MGIPPCGTPPPPTPPTPPTPPGTILGMTKEEFKKTALKIALVAVAILATYFTFGIPVVCAFLCILLHVKMTPEVFLFAAIVPFIFAKAVEQALDPKRVNLLFYTPPSRAI